jgi:asparagine N-glycosylation enzyme membrane subunit Stt3
MVDAAAVKGFLKRYWWVILLVAIIAFGIYVRTGAMKYSDMPDIDTYYFLRMNEYVLNHNFQMPAVDTMRNWPYGERMFDLPVNFFLPAAMYAAVNPLLNISFYRFAFMEPVILAAVGILLMFVLANELFSDKRKAMFATFFFATIPAAITRLSSGEIEKEANSVVFMLLTFIFFFKSYKAPGWKWKGLAYGILSGIFMGVTGLTWGGVQVIYIVISLFVLVMLLINRPQGLWHSFIPMAAIGILLQYAVVPQFTPLTSYNVLFAGFVAVLIIIREAAERFKLIKAESLKFLSIGLLILSFIGVLVSSMFSDFVSSMLNKLWGMVTLYQPTLTTVAESIPGSWSDIISQTGLAFSTAMLPQLSPIVVLFSVWLLMTLGAVIMAYKFVRYRELILVFPIVFILFSAFGVLYALRLAYVLGFSASLAAGYFCGWLLPRAYKAKSIDKLKATSLIYLIAAGFCAMVFVLTLSSPYFSAAMLVLAVCLAIPGYAMRVESQESWMRRAWSRLKGAGESKLDLIMIPVIAFAVLLIAVNMANAANYGNQLGPSINPYFNDAFKFLRESTPKNTSVLSWWDFGYWFQYVGQRATVVDGGGAGDTSRFDVATWFTDDVKNWSKWEPWLNDKLDVSYILMDYTLPGKYGAISKIASHETSVVGITQFDQGSATQQGNMMIQEFNGPSYRDSSGKIMQYKIWIPLTDTGNIGGTPMFLVTDGTAYSNKAYINDLCTEKGIASVGNESQTIGGCIALTQYGLFYVPQEAEHTIFTSLMFMDGYGLAENGLLKVFDNGLIHIYDLKNTKH